MQPVEGRLLLKVTGKRTVYRLATNGARLGTLAAEAASDGLMLGLAAANGCMHYEVVGEPWTAARAQRTTPPVHSLRGGK